MGFRNKFGMTLNNVIITQNGHSIKYKTMNSIQIFFMTLILNSFLCNAQIVFKVNTRLKDNLSQEEYKDIVNASKKITLNNEGFNTLNIKLSNKVSADSNDELTRISSNLIKQKENLLYFIENESYSLIKEKYPLVQSSFYPKPVLNNIIIREKYRKVFKTKADKIKDYLDASNFVPEGERIYLILLLLEDVIIKTL